MGIVMIAALALSQFGFAAAPSVASKQFVADDVVIVESEINAISNFGFPTPAGLTPVSWATADGTAVAGSDYLPASGKEDVGLIAFARVQILPDKTPEPPEYFYIDFSVGGSAPLHYRVTVTVVDDARLPKLSIPDVNIVEGPPGTKTTVRVHLHLSEAPVVPIVADFMLGAETATENVDYDRDVSRRVIFWLGQRDADVEATVYGDSEVENDESFRVCLVQVSNGLFLPGGRNGPQICGRVTILDDDIGPSASLLVADTAIAEGTAAGSVAEFEMTLDRPTSEEVHAWYRTFDMTATAGEDYEPVKGEAVFAPGETRKIISVTVYADSLEEEDEVFALELYQWSNAVIRRVGGLATIVDDDRKRPTQQDVPTVDVSDIRIPEPKVDFVDVPITVGLSKPAAEPIYVGYYTPEISAAAYADYVPRYGVITFAPGEFARTIWIRVLADDDVEEEESFAVYWFLAGPYDSSDRSTVTITPSSEGRTRAVRRR